MRLLISTVKDKVFLKTAASIAVPVALQLVLSTVTNLVDTMMIGSLGTAAISAVGLSNKYFYVLSLLIFGVSSGTGLLMAQFFGNHDFLHIRKSFGLGLLINLAAALIFTLTAGLAPAFVMGLFTESEASTAIGTVYLKTVCFCYPLVACSNLMTGMLRSTRQVRIPLLASVVSILSNILLNYALIFGHFGLPALGIRGAALATVIARVLEMGILLYFSFFRGKVMKGRLSDYFGWTLAFLHNYASHALPVILNEMTWGLGVTLYYVAYGRMGDGAVASVTICETITDVVAVFGNGLYAAAAVLLGNELGANRKEVAWDYSRKMLVLGILLSLLLALVLLPLMRPLLSLFEVSESVRSDAVRCMQMFVLYLPFLFTFGIIIVGVLRAGGDTKMCFLIDTSTVWFIAIPLAFLSSLVWKLPIWVTYALANSEQLFKTVFALIRYRKKVWLKNITNET